MGLLINLFFEDIEKELSVKIWNDIAKERKLDYQISQPIVDFRIPLYVKQEENLENICSNNNGQCVDTDMIIEQSEGICLKEYNKTSPVIEDNDLHLESVVERQQEIETDIDNNSNLFTYDNAEREDEDLVPVNGMSKNDSNGNDSAKIRSAIIENESLEKPDGNFVGKTAGFVLIGDPLNEDENSRSTVDYNETNTCDDLSDVEEACYVEKIMYQERTISQQMPVTNVSINSHDISDIENIIIDDVDVSDPIPQKLFITSSPAGSSSPTIREISETSRIECSSYEKQKELKMPSNASKKDLLKNMNSYKCSRCNLHISHEVSQQSHSSTCVGAFSSVKPTTFSEVKVSSEATKKKLLDNTNSYRCSRCQLRISHEIPRKTHGLTCKGAFFVCKPCNEAFTYKKSLLAHRAKETCLVKSQSCEICGKTFPTSAKIHLIRHIRNCHPCKYLEMQTKEKELLSEDSNDE